MTFVFIFMQLPGRLRLAVAEGLNPELALSQGIPYTYSYPRG